jgi:UDP-N-acetylglucosamine acyltransferase
VIGSQATVSSGVRLAGHVRVGPFANLGMGVAVHQRRTIGPAAMVGMSAVVTRDLLAFSKAYGSPARMHGQNLHLLEKFGISGADGTRLAEIVQQGAVDADTDAQASALAPALWPVIAAWRAAYGVSIKSSPST